MENVQDGGFGGVIPFGVDSDEGTIETVSPAVVVEPTQGIEQVAQVTENDKATVGEDAGKEPQQQPAKDQAKKADQYHKQIIDLLEEKFKAVTDGKMTPQELRQWFDERTEFAEVANRSKRLKDKFRPLMQSDEANRVNPEIAAKRAEQTKDVSEGEMVDDDKPLSKKDLSNILDSYFDSREEKLLSKMSEKERRKELEEYAINKGLKDEAADRFSKLAEVLYKNDETFESFDEALDAAYRVLKPSKSSPQGLSSGSGAGSISTATIENQMIDASQGPHVIDL